MVNGTNREAHVKRVFAITAGSDGNDQINSDLWVDVLRIDELPVALSADEQGQRIQRRYKVIWNDDPNNPLDNVDDSKADIQRENANAVRTTHQLEIKDPDNPDDDHPTLWIVDRLRVSIGPEGTGERRQTVILVFNNTPLNGNGDQQPANREVTVVKVTNNDLNGLKMSDDDGSNPRMIDWQNYLNALQHGTKDDTQHLDVEITDKFIHQIGPSGLGQKGQDVTFVLSANAQLEQLLDSGDSSASLLLRTDPLQSIVNVGFTPGLAVEFGNKAGAP